ncbi:MAG: DUF4270 domain-containing protein [Flavobacteriales bacterium]|nr:DUF4270 domain-containing protein [Flavobacteriales bacterium]
MEHNIERRPLKAAYFVIVGLILLCLSCEKKEDSLGLGLQPDEDFLDVLTIDDLNISTSTVRADSARTNELSRALLGELRHPLFGTMRSTIYSQFRLNALGADFGTNPTVDSLMLNLLYLDNDSVYGPDMEEFTISIKRLDVALDLDSLYYSNYTTEVLDEELAFDPDSIIRFETDEDVIIGEDTLSPRLMVRLKDELGQELLDASEGDDGVFDEIDDFLEYFKGLRISTSRLTTTGAIAYFDLLSASSNMTLYYHNDDEDSLSFEFTINSNAQRYLAFERDYTGTPVADQLNDPSLGQQEVYLQAMAGVNVAIDISQLKNVLDTINGAFNKVEIVVPALEPTENDEFPFPERLFAVYVNSDGDVLSIPDLFEGDAHSDGYYDEDTGEYRVNMTRFAQQIVTEVEDADEIKLLPTSNAVSPNFVRLAGSENPEKRIKLVITYTQFE